MPPVTKKAAQAKKQRADCRKFSSLPSPQPEQGSDSEYEPGFSGESEVEADDISGSIVALQSLYGMFLPANLRAKDNNLTGSDGEPQVNVSEFLLSIERQQCLPSSLVSAKEAENCK